MNLSLTPTRPKTQTQKANKIDVVTARTTNDDLVVVGNGERAQTLAAQLQLRRVDAWQPGLRALVAHDDERLHLVGFVEGGPTALDLAGAALKRASRRCDLARAVGVGKGVQTIVDATAGLGRDAATLAALGCHVVAVERSPILGALWKEALPCAVLPTLSFAGGDAESYLKQARDDGKSPDAIYLDPMFPPRTKAALVGKELRTLSRVLHAEDVFGAPEVDAAALLRLALEIARKRVVVKRPKRAPALAPGFAHQFVGTTVRFDMYLVATP